MKKKLTIVASNKDRLQVKDCNRSEWFLKSIQWQTCDDFELLIADGGSQNYEEIKEYFKNHNGRIKMRIVQHEIGDVFLRAFLNNFGVRNAETDYILCTDVDMLFGKEFIEEVTGVMNPRNLVESRTLYWKRGVAGKVYNGVLDPYEDLDSCKRGRIKKRTTAGGCQCMNIDSWKKVGGYDERYYGWGSEDYDLLSRCKRAKLRVRWLGESREEVALFHQPHPRNTKRDLVYQNKNKRLLNNIKTYKANPDGWGGIKNEEI